MLYIVAKKKKVNALMHTFIKISIKSKHNVSDSGGRDLVVLLRGKKREDAVAESVPVCA